MRWKRWVFPLLIAVTVIGALAWGLRPQPVLAETVQVKRGPLRVTVDEEGKTRLKERYVVSAPVSGYMERIHLREGDTIGAGQALTRIALPPAPFLDPRTRSQGFAELNAAESRIAAAQERGRAARANLEYWRSELDRTNRLLKSGDIARSRYDQAVAEEAKASAAVREEEAAVESTRADLRRARAAVEQTSRVDPAKSEAVAVTAPVGGRVVRLVRESAGPVTAGEALVEIGDAKTIEVEVEVLSPDAVKITPGTRVLFARWGGESALEGSVQQIEPSGRTKVSALGVEEQRVAVIAIITSPPEQWRALDAGYRVEASFVLWEASDVLQIPSSAVFRTEGKSAVFVVEGGVARRRAVNLGHHAGLYVEALDGLKPGEEIVAHPEASIQDGVMVKPR